MPYLIPIDRQGREHHDGLGWVAVDCEQLFFTFHNLALEVRVSDMLFLTFGSLIAASAAKLRRSL